MWRVGWPRPAMFRWRWICSHGRGGATPAAGPPARVAPFPFHGPPPATADVPNIRAAVLAIYAGRDDRINQGIPAIEAAMREHGKVYEKVVYPDVDHAFHT